MGGNGLFSTTDASFAAFLARVGSCPDCAQAFVGRNFLLDEGVLQERVDSYSDAGCVDDHADRAAWNAAHLRYLGTRVSIPAPDGVALSTVDPSDPAACPETFRYFDPESPFRLSDPLVNLVRVEQVQSITNETGEPADEITRLAGEVVRSNWKRDKSYRELDRILDTWAWRADLRPVFVAYWDDVAEAFGDTPGKDRAGRADYVRDRLGLAHCDPSRAGKPIDVLVLCYEVKAVPRLLGVHDSWPLVAPTVLDGRFSAAFCPAPRGQATGHTVDLAHESLRMCREVLHPHMRFEARHIWRVGQVTRSVTDSGLREARQWHLMCVRDQPEHRGYASETDSDLLS